MAALHVFFSLNCWMVWQIARNKEKLLLLGIDRIDTHALLIDTLRNNLVLHNLLFIFRRRLYTSPPQKPALCGKSFQSFNININIVLILHLLA